MKPCFKHIKNQTLLSVLYTFVLQLLFITQIYCQKIPTDSIPTFLPSDTILLDSTEVLKNSNPYDTVNLVYKDDDIKEPVIYKATDSIVYDIENNMLYLYGDSEMDYGDTEVNSELVTFDWTTQTLTAYGVDSAGKKIGTPVLIQGGQTYEAKKMEFNFKTQKGKIYDVVTEDNGAYIHSEIVKKTANNEWLSYKTKYTTCNDKEHPHFYIQARRAKIIPDKVMISGAANLVISGVNTPLALPFAIFPLQKGRRSGLVIPKFGGAGDFFTAKDGGYFWAVNDYLSLEFLGEIITDGTFGLRVNSDYNKRYKYSGNVGLSYRRVMPADPIKNPNAVQNDFNFTWNHRMDNKADPNNNFSAFVKISSNTYNKNQVVQTNAILESINSSNVNYVRRFNGKPYTLAISARFDQSLKTHAFNVTLPEATFTLNKITPFKSKISTGKKKFYEKIGFTYQAKALARVSTTDTAIFTSKTLESLKYGIDQRAGIDATYSLFKYFNITPSFDYNEQWLFKKETQNYGINYVAVNDTTIDTLSTYMVSKNDFYARRNFSANLSVNTKLTGIYNFKKGNVKAIRHVFTPSVSYRYMPDFSKPLWKYYDSYYNEETGKTVEYNQFQNTNVYGTISPGETNSITVTLGNSLEMKVLDKKDTANLYKKVPLLRYFNISSGYNFAGDTANKFQNINISANTSILNGLFGLNASLVYNPYSVNQNNQQVKEFYMKTHQKPLRFKNLNVTLDFNLRGKPKEKDKSFVNEYGTLEEQEYIAQNPELFYDFNIPWSVSARYHISMVNGSFADRDSMVFNFTSLDFNGDINITPKWKVAVSSGFDFKAMDFTFTTFKLLRDLHCWEMSLDWQAYPIRNQSFLFEIRVKSSLLQDLKLSRKNVNYNNTSF